MEPVTPSEGWGVLHLFYKVDRARADAEPGGTKRVLDAIASLEADGHQVLVFTVLGHKAELGIMALGPDVARLQAFQHELAAAPLSLEWSYVSLTERSEYTDDEERARQRLYPTLPRKHAICFYPMSKRREADANWYELPFEQRKQLMGGHARVGRAYAGRVLQLITGSTGLDDWEWGVTLLADDPAALKEIVYDMRFDEVSARYAEFGPFVTGLLLDPAEALGRVGMPNR
jgi:hydrogen peroxide-dependent heme synthase